MKCGVITALFLKRTYVKHDENSDLVQSSSVKRAFAPDARVRPRVSAEERSQLGAGEASFEIVKIEVSIVF